VVRPQLIVGAIALAGLACRDRGAAPRDASPESIKVDVANPLTLDISVTGCASYDAATVTCSGRPPLTVSFAPVGSPELTRFLWTFGDGTPTTTERSPLHTYSHPGSYEVSLVAGTNDVGMVTPPKPLTVQVDALSVGTPCDVDVQCNSTEGLRCICAPGSGCAPAFIRGVCSVPCDANACGPDAVCASVVTGPQPDAGARAGLCLAACQAKAQCAPGFVCQTLPVDPTAAAGAGGMSGSSAALWTRGCLPLGLARDLGAPCRDANEVLRDDACATGTCADVGALGVCSASCDENHACPDGSACARLGDGRRLCLLSCTSDGSCASDPLLACDALAAAVGSGAVSVCAPRSCANDLACPSGRCGPEAVCVRKTN